MKKSKQMIKHFLSLSLALSLSFVYGCKAKNQDSASSKTNEYDFSYAPNYDLKKGTEQDKSLKIERIDGTDRYGFKEVTEYRRGVFIDITDKVNDWLNGDSLQKKIKDRMQYKASIPLSSFLDFVGENAVVEITYYDYDRSLGGSETTIKINFEYKLGETESQAKKLKRIAPTGYRSPKELDSCSEDLFCTSD